jgi:parallel beta-helix repeat protein
MKYKKYLATILVILAFGMMVTMSAEESLSTINTIMRGFQADEPPNFSNGENATNITEYIELLVKTSDNCFTANCSDKKGWTPEMYAEERTGCGKQGEIDDAKPAGWEWGNLERDPKRFAIIRIPAREFNSSWLEPEYNYSAPIMEMNDTCFEICEKQHGKDCENVCLFDTGNYEILTRRKYRLPLEKFLNETELTTHKAIEYNSKVEWAYEKNITDISSLIEYNNWSDRPEELKLHGSSGTFTICPSGCNYTSLATWESTEAADLTGNGPCIANITGDWTGVRDGQTMISGWTTTRDDYILIQANDDARHNGIPHNKSTAYIMNMTDDYTLDVREDFVAIDGMHIIMTYPTGTGYDRAIYMGNSINGVNAEINVSNIILEVQSNPSGFAGCFYSNAYVDSQLNMYNVICTGANFRAIEVSGPNANITNTLCANANTDCFRESTANITSCINCIAFNSTDDFDTFDVVDHCASDDDDGTNNIEIDDWDVQFVDRANYDFHLVSTSDLIDNGTDRSIEGFDTDIDGEDRDATWDVGPDEYVESAAPKEISDCTNITTSGTWTLTANITNTADINCIHIDADDVYLDCQGNFVDGQDADPSEGIHVDGQNNVTIFNCNVTDFKYNTYVINSWDINFSHSDSASAVYDNLYIYNTTDSHVHDNNLHDSEYDAMLLYDSINITVYNNHFVDSTNSGTGVYLYRTNESTIYDNEISTNLQYGIYCYRSMTSNYFENNTINDNGYGVYLTTDGDNNTFVDNIFDGNTYAYYLNDVILNNITSDVPISSDTADYYITGSSNNNKFTNTSFDSARKIQFGDTSSNFIYNDNTSGNVDLYTNISAASTLTRLVTIWNITNIKWNDTNSTNSISVNYSIDDLHANSNYELYINDVYDSNVSTGSDSTLTAVVSLDGETEIEFIYAGTVVDTCGTCTIDCTENCIIDSNLDCSGGDLSFVGSGVIRFDANVTNWDDVLISGGCKIVCHGGNCYL